MNPITLQIDGATWEAVSRTAKRIILRPVVAIPPLAAAREAQGLTQRAAAPLLGISQGQLARIESGTRLCPDDVIKAARKLGWKV